MSDATTPAAAGTDPAAGVELSPVPAPAAAGPFDHLSDRELQEGIAHALNAQAEQVAWLVGKVVQAEAMIAAAASDPKLRMLLPKIGG